MKKIFKTKEFIIDQSASVLSAMKAINEIGSKIIFVCNENNKVIGSVSDGDIRRYILSGGDLNKAVKSVVNEKFVWLPEKSDESAEELFVKTGVTCIPMLSKSGNLTALYFNYDYSVEAESQTLDFPVVIQAGGKGTRLYPYTHILPKPLIPINELPIIEHIINSFKKHGCKKFYVIVNNKKEMIKAYFADTVKDYEIRFIDENTPLGTAGGLVYLKDELKTSFFFTNCDILIDADYGDIVKLHKEQGAVGTIVSAVKNFVFAYGVLNINNNGAVESMSEKPSFNFITNTGLYFLEPKIFEILKEPRFISMPDVLSAFIDKGETISTYPISENCWHDMGQIDDLNKMQGILKLRGDL